jgi:hypothetical protein
MQALDAICEWFLEAGVLPSTCMQYVLPWLHAASQRSGHHIPPSAQGSAPAHIEVILSAAARMFMRIVMHPKYPISHGALTLLRTPFPCFFPSHDMVDSFSLLDLGGNIDITEMLIARGVAVYGATA